MAVPARPCRPADNVAEQLSSPTRHDFDTSAQSSGIRVQDRVAVQVPSLQEYEQVPEYPLPQLPEPVSPWTVLDNEQPLIVAAAQPAWQLSEDGPFQVPSLQL